MQKLFQLQESGVMFLSKEKLLAAVEKYNAAQASENTRIDPQNLLNNLEGCTDAEIEKAITELEKGAE